VVAALVVLGSVSCGSSPHGASSPPPSPVTEATASTPITASTTPETSTSAVTPDGATTAASAVPMTTPPTAPASAPTTIVSSTTIVPSTEFEDSPAALQECRDVRTIAPTVVGDDPSAPGPDPVFLGVLLTYAAEHDDTFGGMWMDREAKGTMVLAFTDDPVAHRAALAERRPSPDDIAAVSPAPPITDTRPIGEWGVPFDVVQVTYAQPELQMRARGVATALEAAGLTTFATSSDITRNRVSIASSEPITADTADQIASVIAAGFGSQSACIDGVISEHVPEPLKPGAPLDVILLPDADGTYPAETPVQCGFVEFTLGELQHLTPIADADPSLSAVVDAWLRGPASLGTPTDGWAVLTADQEQATIVRITNDTFGVINATMGRNGWVWAGATAGRPCDVTIRLPEGMGRVSWTLDPAFAPPDPATAELHILATEQACTGASSMGERLLGPQVLESDSAVRIGLAAIPLTGNQTCPSNPSTPVTISLRQPLGDRAVLDGTVIGSVTDLAAPTTG
jgi:hypothetical protein